MDNPQVLCSVDIGLSGGISFFDTESKELLSLHPMPTKKFTNKSGKEKNVVDLDKLKFILEIPKEHGESCLVVMEDVHSFPGQGVVSMGTLMEQKGLLRGLSKALGYDELLISPKEWQKHFDLIPPKELKGTSGAKTKTLRKKWLKENSLAKARELFPEVAETKLVKSTNHGLSDALLIGKYWIDTCQSS
jgi:hypothetical protein